MHQTIMNKPPT